MNLNNYSISQCEHETKSLVRNLSFLLSLVKTKLCIFFDKQLDIVYKIHKNHVCLLKRKHVVDRHALRLIQWIGEPG